MKDATETSRPDRLVVPVNEDDHRRGALNAPLVLVEYGDFECPFCAEADQIVKELQERLGDQLCYVFRHYPLSNKHAFAQRAAEAAEAAAAQGKFWEMHDVLFENQDALDDEDLAEYAIGAGLEVERWTEDLETSQIADRVMQDFQTGSESGVSGTPTFFINGVLHEGEYALNTLLPALSKQVQA